MIEITFCPTCGSKNIKKARRDFTRTVKGQTYTVSALEFHECPDCGEKLFDAEAMRKIEWYSPSFPKPRRLKITVCPTCGSDNIKLVRKDQTREFEGRVYTVPDLEFHECPDCGEEVYSPEAVRKIQAYSPAFSKAKRKKKAA